MATRIVKLLALLSAPSAICSVFSTVACATENCDLKKQPAESSVSEGHGRYYLVFPRTLGSSYTGCQTEWDEDGVVWWVLKFDRGNLIEFLRGEKAASEGLSRSCK